MAFQQGLSGLASAARAIDVTSNNIANASTVGFKSSSAQFADVYAASLIGSVAANQAGIGSAVLAVRQNFTSGGVTTTNNPLDLAINGNGFFMVRRSDGSEALTRNGQFGRDPDFGFIVTSQGDRLLGYPPGITAGTLVPLSIPVTGIPAISTTEVRLNLNLQADDEIPSVAPPTNTGANSTDSYNYTTSVRVFDSLGIEHSLSFYFVKTGTDRTWEVYRSFDGEPLEPMGSISFTENGLFNEALDDLGDPISGNLFTLDYDFQNGSDPAWSTTVDFASSTQFANASAVRDLFQNGARDGELVGFSIGSTGVIEGRYSNGQTRNLGTVALADVNNPNGLRSLGNNLWVATPDSGPVIHEPPGTQRTGGLTAGAVEDSNVDLTQELVQLIIQQRNYQANAQSIRTQDQLLQTVVNLR